MLCLRARWRRVHRRYQIPQGRSRCRRLRRNPLPRQYQLLIVDEMILTLPAYGEIIAPPLAVLNPFRSVTPVIVRDEAPGTLKIPLLDWFPSMNVFAWLPLDAMLMFFETSMLFSKYVPGLRRIVSPGCTPGRLMVALITPVPD